MLNCFAAARSTRNEFEEDGGDDSLDNFKPSADKDKDEEQRSRYAGIVHDSLLLNVLSFSAVRQVQRPLDLLANGAMMKMMTRTKTKSETKTRRKRIVSVSASVRKNESASESVNSRSAARKKQRPKLLLLQSELIFEMNYLLIGSSFVCRAAREDDDDELDIPDEPAKPAVKVAYSQQNLPFHSLLASCNAVVLLCCVFAVSKSCSYQQA